MNVVSMTRFAARSVLALALLAARSAFADGLSLEAARQIQALLDEKEARTEAQRKLDSNLLFAIRMNRGEAIAAGISRLDTGVDPGVDGAVVDIVARDPDRVGTLVESLGGAVLDLQIRARSLRALMPLQAVERLAADPRVVFVQPRQEYVLARQIPKSDPGNPPPASARTGRAEKAALVRAQLARALGDSATNKLSLSEGDVTHRADLARATFGANGAGVKVGVLSNGVASLATLQASGDLPPTCGAPAVPPCVTVLPGQAGSGDEGSAMLEIIHDLAPGAQLFFATANPSIGQFAQNIRDLRTAGCDVIIDDVTYFVETPFQKGQAPSVVSNTNGGLVTQAVVDVTAAGALFFSSAGNSGNLDHATSGTWEGDFVDGGASAAPLPLTGNVHSFGAQTYDTLMAVGNLNNLYWSDPLGGSANDYDLFRLNAAGSAVVASSTNVQSGTQDPYEQITAGAVNERLVILRKTGAAARFLHLSTFRGRLSIATAGETHGHNAPPGLYAFSVAATPAVGTFGAGYPTGPYPGVFSSSNGVELFSSDGLRRWFYNSDSTPITPGNLSSSGGEVGQKPDFTAADGVSCSAPGFASFFGTSAAAPHAGAIAALVKSAAPAATQAQLRAFLVTGAIDIDAAGVDRTTGLGILDAYSAVAATGATAQAGLVVGTATLVEATGNGNGFVEPGECGSLTLQLRNLSQLVGATAVSATIATSTPGVTLDSTTASWPDIPANGSATNTLPFRFRLSTSAACPLSIDFTITISLTGGPGTVQAFTARAGLPAPTVATTLDTTPPPASSVYTAATGLQTGRLQRTGVASTCAAPKANPGLNTAVGARPYDAYSFHASSNGCITVALTSAVGINLFSVTYLGSFVPANPSTNYLADAGSSGGTTSYSFNVTAGQDFVVVVHEVPVTGGTTYPYTLTVDGLCFGGGPYTTTYSCCPPPPPIGMNAPTEVGAGSPGRVASIAAIPGATYLWSITNGTITSGQGTNQITFTAGTAGTPLTLQVVATVGGCPAGGALANVTVLPAGSAVQFYPITPCRVVDTRGPNAPSIAGPGTPDRTFAVVGVCGVPSGATAVTGNLTVVNPTGAGYVLVYRGDGLPTGTSMVNFVGGQTRASEAILQLASDGSGTVKVSNGSGGTLDLLVDVTGYFR